MTTKVLKVGVRIDSTLHSIIQRMLNDHATVSQAARVLMKVGADKTNTVEDAIRNAAFQEGLLLGVRAFREMMNKHLAEVMRDFDPK